MSDRPTATVRRRRLGIELRRLREEAGVTIEEVAGLLERSVSTVSRIETGKTSVRVRDVRDMLDRYGVADERQREELFALARETQASGWWQGYPGIEDLDLYVGLEAEAARIRAYDTTVHGLLQTEDYARAIFQSGRHRNRPDLVDRLIQMRIQRQAVLTRNDEPPTLWVIQDEASIRRMVGGAAVMRAQLERLAELSALPNVTVQVLPFVAGAHPAMAGSFALVESRDPHVSPVMYVECAGGNLYVERDLDTFGRVFADLSSAALAPDASIRFLRDAAAALS